MSGIRVNEIFRATVQDLAQATATARARARVRVPSTHPYTVSPLDPPPHDQHPCRP